MVVLLLLHLLGTVAPSGRVTAEDPIPISGHLGSDLYLPVADACRLTGSYRYDISNSIHNIGMYDGDLQPLNGYKGRLTYNEMTCNITLKNLTEQDGTRFTVKFYEDINGKPTWHAIYYRVNIRGPPPSPSYTRETTQIEAELTAQNTFHNSTDGRLRLASLCLSLDMTVNALLPLLLWIIQECRKKLKEDAVNFGCHINSCLTFLFHTISFSAMYRGNSSGLLLVLVPIILLLDTLIGILKYYEWLPQWALKVLQINYAENSTRKRIACMVWRWILLLIQIFFPVFVGHLYYTIDNNILTSLGEFWYLPCLSVIVSFVLKTGVFFVAYCYKRTPLFSSVRTDEGQTIPDGPEEVRV